MSGRRRPELNEERKYVHDIEPGYLDKRQAAARRHAGLPRMERARKKPEDLPPQLRLTPCTECGAVNPTLPQRKRATRCEICGSSL